MWTSEVGQRQREHVYAAEMRAGVGVLGIYRHGAFFGLSIGLGAVAAESKAVLAFPSRSVSFDIYIYSDRYTCTCTCACTCTCTCACACACACKMFYMCMCMYLEVSSSLQLQVVS